MCNQALPGNLIRRPAALFFGLQLQFKFIMKKNKQTESNKTKTRTANVQSTHIQNREIKLIIACKLSSDLALTRGQKPTLFSGYRNCKGKKLIPISAEPESYCPCRYLIPQYGHNHGIQMSWQGYLCNLMQGTTKASDLYKDFLYFDVKVISWIFFYMKHFDMICLYDYTVNNYMVE